MESNDIDLSDYSRIIFRQFRFIFIFVMLFTAAGFIAGHLIPRRYSARALLQINFDHFFDGAKVDPGLLYNLKDNLSSIILDISGQNIILQAAQSAGRISDTASDVSFTHDNIEIVEEYREKITLTPVADKKQIQIDVISADPREAALIANAVGNTYQRNALEFKRKHLDRMQYKIRETLEQCRKEAADISNMMSTTKSNNPELIDDFFYSRINKKSLLLDRQQQKTDFDLSNIAALRNDLTELRSELLQSTPASSRKPPSHANKKLPAIDWMSELTYEDPGLELLTKQITRISEERSEYMQYYHFSHPKMASIDRQLREAIELFSMALNRNETALKQKNSEIINKQSEMSAKADTKYSKTYLLDRLNNRYTSQLELCESIEEKLSDAHITASGLVPFVTIASQAAIPTSPVGISTMKMTAAGLVAGLLFGLIIALFREIANTSLGTIEDVKRTFNGYLIMGTMPCINTIKKVHTRAAHDTPDKKLLPVLFDPASSASEAFRMLSVRLHTAQVNQPRKTILVTSAATGEGKSFIAANLALTLSLQGKQVLLLEANFRRPSLSYFFGLPPLPGLAEILIEKAAWESSRVTISDLLLGTLGINEIIRIQGIDNFTLIPFGSHPPNPGELLSSEVMHRILEEFREVYDHIIIDAPSVMPVADPLLLAHLCDSTIMVYYSDRTPRGSLASAIKSLEGTGIERPVLLLNNWHRVPAT